MRRLRLVGSLGVVLVLAVAIAAVVLRGGGSTAAPARGSAAPPSPLTAPASVAAKSLLTGSPSTFNGTDSRWSGTDGATLSRSTQGRRGPGSMEISSAAGGQAAAWSPAVHLTGGQRVVGTAYLRAVTAPRAARLELEFLDSSGHVTDTEKVAQPATGNITGWTAMHAVAAISPKGTAQVRLGVVFPIVGPGAEQLVDDARISATPGGSTNVVGPLTTRGSQIVQGNGKPLLMRGIQRFGLEGGTKTPLPTNSEIGQLKLWGANEVRISLGEQKWLASNCHYEPGYAHEVDRVVHWVTSRGMVALLNLHFSTLTDCGPAGLTAMADSPGAITFWEDIASRYQSNRLVAFDLFNEPTVSSSVWLNGGTFTESKLKVAAAGMQQLYNAVRSTGATNLVVISGLDYADHPPVRTVDGDDIAYAAHAYTCEASPPPSCQAPHPYDASVPLDHWVGFAAAHPVVVTEFGWPNGDDGRYNTSVVQFAERHGWGWSGFAWDGGTDGKFDLIQNHLASDGRTIEPNAGGMALLAGFARNTLTSTG